MILEWLAAFMALLAGSFGGVAADDAPAPAAASGAPDAHYEEFTLDSRLLVDATGYIGHNEWLRFPVRADATRIDYELTYDGTAGHLDAVLIAPGFARHGPVPTPAGGLAALPGIVANAAYAMTTGTPSEGYYVADAGSATRWTGSSTLRLDAADLGADSSACADPAGDGSCAWTAAFYAEPGVDLAYTMVVRVHYP